MSERNPDFIEQCRLLLAETWQQVAQRFDATPPHSPLPEDDELTLAIRASLKCKTKSYHYVLPTQLLAKVVDPNLDARALQAAYDHPGAFDARSLAHKVIVPFDQSNFGVLGNSPEPYVNNPLRVPAVTSEFRAPQKDKSCWDQLVTVLDAAQMAENSKFVGTLLEQTLFELYRLLAGINVVYPTPNRVSLQQTQLLLNEYFGDKSGGERVETVCTAFFRTIAREFNLFDEVKREKVNAADIASGMSGDIECWAGDRVVLLVEVKDRSLTLTQLEAKLDLARSRHISELLFIAKGGKKRDDAAQIDLRIQAEFASGQNIYVAELGEFARGVLILLGERGRVSLLDEIGRELDRVKADIRHRRAWADLLRTV